MGMLYELDKCLELKTLEEIVAERIVYTCDGCGVEKKESNHWFSLIQREGFTEISVWGMRAGNSSIYCGDACVMKAVSAWLNEKKQAVQP